MKDSLKYVGIVMNRVLKVKNRMFALYGFIV